MLRGTYAINVMRRASPQKFVYTLPKTSAHDMQTSIGIACGVKTSVQAMYLPAYSGLQSSIQEVTGSKGPGLLDAANGTSLTMRIQL